MTNPLSIEGALAVFPPSFENPVDAPSAHRGEDHQPEPEIKLHPEWINVEDLKLWIHTCTTEHGDKCANLPPSLPPGSRPEWLIDVETECVVPATAPHRYLALSYVWGQVPSTELTRGNLEILRQPGALAWRNLNATVPKTIRHAMGLVRVLGERYLWVDRFCILQDDAASKHKQLERMGAIYANAHVTIIAANGWDADHGLRGLKGITDSRYIRPNFHHDYADSIKLTSSYWNNRGWTFQEVFFSRRKLFFAYQVAVWECSCGVWNEGTGTTGDIPWSNYGAKTPAGGPVGRGRVGDFIAARRGTKGWASLTSLGNSDIFRKPDVHEYFTLVSHYNPRRFTYPEDGYNAFLGVVSCLEPLYPGGFIWGLPVMAFEESLLWAPWQVMTRRLPRFEGSRPLPSWSWVGWEGVTAPRRSEGPVSYPSPPPVADFVSRCKWTWPGKNDLLLPLCEGTASGAAEEASEPGTSSRILQITAETATITLKESLYWLDGWPLNGAGLMGPEESSEEARRVEALLVAHSTQPPSEYRYANHQSEVHWELPTSRRARRIERFSTTWAWCDLLLIERDERDGTACRKGVALIPEEDWGLLARKEETVFLV